MGIEERKLRLIQQFMDVKNDEELGKIEEVLSEIELNRRARSSEQDIENGRLDDFEKFRDDMKKWMKEKRRTA